ncbi:MAG TPA: ABC transporter ATP-binding protein [Gammaproteobacteria bacterium]|nr:ABC transporter ATP-binding protein [Gammaproteobacteria bacterium]
MKSQESIAITIKGVEKHFGQVHALRGIDLEIRRGEFFGLLGPNGAGKSTLINTIAGLTRADTGQISVMGYDVVKQYRMARRCIGIVPQELVYDSFFNVREMLRLQAGYFGCGRESHNWIEELLDVLMLHDKADTSVKALSGGMKRRVLVAMALVHKPDVVVLDEPTAGVDVELRQSLWEFIKRLHNEGHTIVLTTHYLEEAESLCDRIAILGEGKIIALDSKQGLLDRGVNHVQLVTLTTEDPIQDIPAQLSKNIKQHNGSELVLQLNQKTDNIIDLLDAVRNTGAIIKTIKTSEADLEDVFMEITNNGRLT